MPDPRRRVCNVGACLLWGFIACALAYGLLLLVVGVILAVQDR